MKQNGLFFLGLGVAVGVAASLLVQKLSHFKIELAEFLIDEEEDEMSVGFESAD